MTTTSLQTIYPPEVAEALRAGGIAMAGGDKPHICINCGGWGVLAAFKVKGGPFKNPTASGAKWMTIDGKAGWYNGELVVDHCPVCSGSRTQEHLRKICGLEGKELNVSLETYKITGPLAAKAEALQLVRGIMAQNRNPAGFVTLLGDKETSYGVGKSHLAMGLINGFRGVGIASRYTTLSDLLAELKEHFGRDQQVKTEELVERYRTIRVLVIDEVDKVELTGWDKQAVFRLIDARYRQQHELLTVLAANAYTDGERLWLWTHDKWGNPAVEAWPAELGYLQSRIMGGLTVTVPGPDYRKMQGLATLDAALSEEPEFETEEE